MLAGPIALLTRPRMDRERELAVDTSVTHTHVFWRMRYALCLESNSTENLTEPSCILYR